MLLCLLNIFKVQLIGNQHFLKRPLLKYQVPELKKKIFWRQGIWKLFGGLFCKYWKWSLICKFVIFLENTLSNFWWEFKRRTGVRSLLGIWKENLQFWLNIIYGLKIIFKVDYSEKIVLKKVSFNNFIVTTQ